MCLIDSGAGFLLPITCQASGFFFGLCFLIAAYLQIPPNQYRDLGTLGIELRRILLMHNKWKRPGAQSAGVWRQRTA